MFGLELMILLAIAVAAYMAWNIGANDVANAMGTSVGSGALTFRNAIIAAAVFEFLGAFFAGDAVTDTVRKGILNFEEADLATYSTELKFGFVAAMFAAALWLTFATRYGLPVSTTHSIIGGILGIGMWVAPQHVDWAVVSKIALSWIMSPLLGGLLAFGTFHVVRITIMEADDPVEKSRRMAPLLALPTFFVLGLALQYKALKGAIKRLDAQGVIDKADWLPSKAGITFNPFADGAWLPINSLLLALALAILASLVLYWILRDYEFEEEGYAGVERIFIWLQIITACYVAFAHGANDRSNAIGPMAAVWQISQQGVLESQAAVPTWLILLGSAGITVGVMTWGARVMVTIGRKITHITPTRGFAAEFGAATTVLIFSMPFLAVPISTTHTLVGAVVGVGLAGGTASVDFRVFGRIAASWVASLPAAAGGAILLYILFGLDETRFAVVVSVVLAAIIYLITRSIIEEPKPDILMEEGGAA
ncbi:MAG: hypothetical protein BEU05_00125 [Marine Group III euryarchaeote CG-Bathy2]|uniref:Phosphate transporter n=4 Tax=Methanobacteriati TaxID=3366610 RepID=A0A075GLF0_9EURY|nr:Phosphate transporter family protein (TC.PIT) [uncultured marine group II/III euryarchaeote KM3_157_C11]AIF10372.1 Phosphate transporter family protein (TC.PIT) [uncultured marine group II/III euryarchaeote KM3_45_C02]AIF17286.1 Phosphate transporter family protein (TC.PIT) [uncultured marine group II/III euryarchaeote KM3_76_H07]OIR12972.1 MAG: hypothetical protein BEU05_00125 [Marine Group III euryarchaeote CG-Bathy2]